MSTDVYTHDNKNVTIDSIEFGILGNKEVLNMSVIKDINGLSKPESYNNFEPVIGGLVDRRLGITDSHLECATCGHNTIKCPGHFGHISLAEPVYHVGYIPYIKKILSCICIKCSKLLVYKNETEIENMLKNKSGKARFAEIRNLCKSVSYCQQINYGCGAPVPKIKVDIKKSTSAINIIAETNISTLSTDEKTGNITDSKKKIKQIITPEMCYSILKNISDIDCEIMGLDPKKTRPEMMILKQFPVPPVQVRPSAKADFLASATFEDDLTHKLADIINANVRIRKYKEKEGTDGKHSVFSTDTLYLLQYHVATFFDNDSVSLLKSEQRNGKPVKSVSARLKTKEGRVRGNLMGKRVDFSSRTVIGPDPNLEINELGVPLKIAMNLTFPEVVTPYNIDRLTELVRNGRDKYPGANFVFPISSFTSEKRYIIDLRYRKDNVILRFGDVVERHIINGDVVLFNRQPSLHKLSMMAHKIRVINNMNLSTFKLNLAVTSPYNADFDGDEMNMFVPQSIQTQIELDLIANVKRQIISPGTSAPIIGCVQDAVLGSYLFTAENNKISWRDIMNLMMYTSVDDVKIIKNKNYSGNDVFSKIIPDKINMNTMTDAGKVSIKNGELKEGQLSKKIIGSKKNSIIHLIWNEYGMEETKNFLDNCQRLINNWLLNNGFTISLGDTFIDNKLIDQIQDIVESKKLEINHLITEMENNPEVMDGDIFERSIAADLNAIGGTVNELVYNNLNDDNNFYVTITSGSKGSKINMGAIGGIVGQQNVEGKRIRKRVNNRTLYHFHQNDDSALARGFCQNSYLDGLSPYEFYFHTMAGREGLIDTAIKTADTGYIQRKLIKALEDILIKYDGTVRNSNNTIIQFLYGDNNINPANQIEHNLNIVNMNNKDILEKYKFTSDQLKSINKNIKTTFSDKDNNKLYESMINIRDELRFIQRKATLNYITMNDKYMLPVDLNRIINNIKYTKLEKDTNVSLDPQYILDTLNNLLLSKNTRILCMSKNQRENKDSLKFKDEMDCKTLFKFSLFEYLSPKRCIIEYKLNKMKFDTIINNIISDYKNALVQPGEMVGVVAAQSIGEPATQMSISYETKINLINSKGKVYSGMIGEFIDRKINNNPNNVIDLGNSSYEAKLDEDYYIMTVNENEKTEWSKISHVSKHPPNGDLMKVLTMSGREITATMSHSFLKRTENKIVPIEGYKLRKGDRIPIGKYIPKHKNIINKIDIESVGVVKLDNLFGCIVGYYLSENTDLLKDNMKNYEEEFLLEYLEKVCGKDIKHVPDYSFNAPLEFLSGIIRGLFDGNGIINSNTNVIKLESKSKDLIDQLSLLLNYFDITTIKSENDLQISHNYSSLFLEKIGSNKENEINKIIEYANNNKKDDIDKIPCLTRIINIVNKKLELECNNKLDNESIERYEIQKYINKIENIAREKQININNEMRLLRQAVNSNIIWDEITDIKVIKNYQNNVYDFTVPNTQTFITQDGIYVHNTLNTFHFTGIASKGTGMLGVPRLRELLSFSKNPKMPRMSIYLKENLMENKAIANKIASYIKYTTIYDLSKKIEVYYDPLPFDNSFRKKDNVVKDFKVLNATKTSCQNDITLLPWLYRIELDKELMLEKNVTLLDIKSKFCTFWGQRLSDPKNLKKEDRLLIEKITQTSISTNYDNSETPIIHIRLDMNNFDFSTIIDFQNLVMNKFKLKGIDGISDINDINNERVIIFNENGDIEKKNQHIIYTDGINLKDIRYINGVDLTKTITSDVVQIYKLFGIEAARTALVKELRVVIESGGNFANYQHIAILVDVMTNTGSLTSIDRHGINRLDTDPLSRASFEKTVEQLLTAAVFGEVDSMRSVSSRVMVGRVIKGGTGLCELMMDTDILENTEYMEEYDKPLVSTFTELSQNSIIKDTLKKDDVDIFIP